MNAARADYSVLLRQLADLAELHDAAGEAAELRRGASVLATLGPGGAERLARLEPDARVAELGIDRRLHARLRELAVRGAPAVISAASAGLPWLLQRLLEIPHVSTDEALRLARRLAVLTLADLERTIDDGSLARELGPTAAGRLRAAAESLSEERMQLPLGRALERAEELSAAIAAAIHPAPGGVSSSGPIRRAESFVDHVAIIVCSPDPPRTVQEIARLPDIERVLFRSDARLVVLYRRTEIDVHVSQPENHGTVMVTTTGSRAHLRGLGHVPTLSAPSEEAYYRLLGLPFIPPEIRNGTGEIETARADRLPALVGRSDIRGDLHLHTTYSDGRDSVASMVAAAAALGYEYVAITDHSHRANASRTVSVDQLARQAEELARVRQLHPEIAVLHGIEVEILADGRLDFDDEVLERLDIVLASLHDPAGHDRARLTGRCLEAIRHPLVNVITHPSNRIVGQRPAFDMDFETIAAAAAGTGTALEIDGAPSHLDMDGEHARAAISAGVTVTIDSDSHRSSLLDRQMRLGIAIARRGWVEPRHVLNARPVEAVRSFVAAKRTGRPGPAC